jgi:hypothetical protein
MKRKKKIKAVNAAGFIHPEAPGDGKKKEKKAKKTNLFRYGELNPGLAGLMLCLRAADASHYTITDLMSTGYIWALIKVHRF